ncbi:MAG: 1-acyl-sn-glycerol-3-phosphate acyltransferase, partial [Polyangiales bacterium]
SLRLSFNIVRQSINTIRFCRENRTVFLSVLGISWFWFYGAMFLAQIPGYARDVLGGDQSIVTTLLAAFSVGVGVGSIACEKLSGHRIEIGLVPFGAIGLTLFGVDVFFASRGLTPIGANGVGAFLSHGSSWRIVADMTMIGVFGGFYIVPLCALVQHRSRAEVRSRIIAANNILNALFMVVAAVIAVVLRQIGLSVAEIFLITAVLNAVVAIYIFTVVPEFLMRFLVWILMSTVYRLKTTNVDVIPEEGPALIVCNHVSFVDALIISAACRRPIRFVMYHKIFDIPVLQFVFRTANAIPIAPPNEDEALMHRAFDTIADALNNGELVGIFPEGSITRDGAIHPFRGGVERIVERTPVVVIPSALRGLWGSFFSRKDGSAMQRFPRRFWSKIEYVCGEPVPANAVSRERLHEEVARLRGDWA